MERQRSKEWLRRFLLEECERRGLSLRGLSIKSGLSPGTVHSIINRKYRPTLNLLNRLADYLSVKRAYLWQLAGLLEGTDYQSSGGDSRLRSQLVRAQKLPEPARDLLAGVIELVLEYFETAATQPNG